MNPVITTIGICVTYTNLIVIYGMKVHWLCTYYTYNGIMIIYYVFGFRVTLSLQSNVINLKILCTLCIRADLWSCNIDYSTVKLNFHLFDIIQFWIINYFCIYAGICFTNFHCVRIFYFNNVCGCYFVKYVNPYK